MTDCIYRGAATGAPHEGEPLWACQRHGTCVDAAESNGVAACGDCPDRLPAEAPDFARRWRDPLLVYDRAKETTGALRGVLAGRSAFLACGGPSARALPLEALAERGVWTMAVNNAAGHFPCQAFVCSDPPSKFSHSVWLDPAIMKLIPRPKMDRKRGRLRRKLPREEWQVCDRCRATGRDGDRKCPACGGLGCLMFGPLLGPDGRQMSAIDCPNVWGFSRRSWLACDDTFFTDPAASWGNQAAGVARTGEQRTACTMLLAMRLLRYLGAGRVFLLGVDFGMDPGRGPTGNYAFGELRDRDACQSNNMQYVIANSWLCRLQAAGVFERFGIEFYNCNASSGLRAFSYVPFDEALADVRAGVEPRPDLEGWYAK